MIYGLPVILCSGKIPLRQLVYRVLDLPPSMRPLVYDFGQLQQRTEDDYIRQIVQDHVSQGYIIHSQKTSLFYALINQVTYHTDLSQESPHYIKAIADVLAWSQDYMRSRKVCYFNVCVYMVIILLHHVMFKG